MKWLSLSLVNLFLIVPEIPLPSILNSDPKYDSVVTDSDNLWKLKFSVLIRIRVELTHIRIGKLLELLELLALLLLLE